MTEPNQKQDHTYKFMTNILAPANTRTRYVGLLKGITPDAQVSFSRIIIALAGLMVIAVTTIVILSNAEKKLPYIAIPTIIGAVMTLILLVVYVLSSRNKSMLSSVFELGQSFAVDRARMSNSKNGEIKSVGISSCENGVLYFDNGDVGLMFAVEGQMSFGMIPAIAHDTASRRQQYYTSRQPTTQEILITSVQRADVRPKLNSCRETYLSAKNSDDPRQEWVAHMSNTMYRYIDDNMAQNDTQLFQTLILREGDIQALKKARELLYSSTREGIYANLTPVSDPGEIARRLSPMTLLSIQGLSDITGEDEEKNVLMNLTETDMSVTSSDTKGDVK